MMRMTVTCNSKAAWCLMPTLKFVQYHRCIESQVIEQPISVRIMEQQSEREPS